jgi:hypothetical protein
MKKWEFQYKLEFYSEKILVLACLPQAGYLLLFLISNPERGLKNEEVEIPIRTRILFRKESWYLPACRRQGT